MTPPRSLPLSLQCPSHEYQQLMETGQLSSEILVNAFMDQIDRHNHNGLKLNAVLSVCPRDVAVSQARRLDEERRRGEIRSDLHGIPIIIKDAIVTDPSLGMVTSAGSCAIASLKAKRNASVVDRLLSAGVIILGKGNLTEFCGLKSDKTPIGWSAYGGQSLSPYRRENLKEEDQPWSGGSSVGPAVSIAAGFAPLGLGTETGGSNVLPASLSGLYGLTLPRGSVPIDGVQRISEMVDRLGLMARNPRDLAALAKILLGPGNNLAGAGSDSDGESDSSRNVWKGLSIGILESEYGTDPAYKWKWGSAEVKEKYDSVAKKLGELGARVVFPLEDPPQPEMLQYEGETLHTVSYHEFAGVLQDFITTNFEHDPKLTNLADLVAWNEAHAEEAMPHPYTTQTELLKCLDDTMSPSRHDAALAALRHLAQEDGMARYMRSHNLDIVLSSSDSALIAFSACAGWPVATVPVGNMSKNDQPWGFFALARDGRMDLLMRFITKFHECFDGVRGPRRPFA